MPFLFQFYGGKNKKIGIRIFHIVIRNRLYHYVYNERTGKKQSLPARLSSHPVWLFLFYYDKALKIKLLVHSVHRLIRIFPVNQNSDTDF